MQEDEEMYVFPAYGTKVCPQCGQTLFDDMDVCYGCLYEFGKYKGPGRVVRKEDDPADEDLPTVLGTEPVQAGESWQEDEVPTEAYELGWTACEEAPAERRDAPEEPRYWFRVCSNDMEVRIPLPKEGLLVGRGADCDVVLHGRSVSRRHVLIAPGEDGVLVRDQGAKNPASIAGDKVAGEASLQPGDELDVCGVTFALTRE